MIWNPTFADETFTCDVLIEEIHRVIDGFHLLHHDNPTWQLLRNVGENALTMVLRLIQHHV